MARGKRREKAALGGNCKGCGVRGAGGKELGLSMSQEGQEGSPEKPCGVIQLR